MSSVASLARTSVVVGMLLAAAAALAASAEREAEVGGSTVDSLYDVQYLLNLAEQGDARAAFLLGTRFASGRGGAQDDSEAFRWFREASEAGLAEAQYNLGIMYANGRGVQRDMVEAARWYKAAADQGIAEAQFNIGTLYGLGLGVARNEQLAAGWLTKAADKGLPQAQYNLGVLFEHGRGVRLDARAALDWYRRAARQGFPQAQARYDALNAKLTLPEAPATAEQSPSAAPEKAAPPASDPPAPTKVAARPAAHGRWIAGAEPSGYTLQLLSDTDEANVKRFVARNIRPGEGDYFATERDGQVWYSVVYGVYDSYSAAKQAVSALPAAFGDRKPWIRKVGSIQQLMIR
ncbi:MAG TPA: SPOR domain-containing protein [Gammaproteobacteria bacterium]